MAERYLGQFTDDNAERILAAFDEADIPCGVKSSGRLVRTLFAGDWGTRLFVLDEHADAAWAIAEDIAPHGVARRPRRR